MTLAAAGVALPAALPARGLFLLRQCIFQAANGSHATLAAAPNRHWHVSITGCSHRSIDARLVRAGTTLAARLRGRLGKLSATPKLTLCKRCPEWAAISRLKIMRRIAPAKEPKMSVTKADHPLRVIQWTTGNIGRRSLHAIIGRPDMELVGVYAHGAGQGRGGRRRAVRMAGADGG